MAALAALLVPSLASANPPPGPVGGSFGGPHPSLEFSITPGTGFVEVDNLSHCGTDPEWYWSATGHPGANPLNRIQKPPQGLGPGLSEPGTLDFLVHFSQGFPLSDGSTYLSVQTPEGSQGEFNIGASLVALCQLPSHLQPYREFFTFGPYTWDFTAPDPGPPDPNDPPPGGSTGPPGSPLGLQPLTLGPAPEPEPEPERKERYRLDFMTFIPSNYLALAAPVGQNFCVDKRERPSVVTEKGNKVRKFHQLIGHGDDRSFDARAARRPPDAWHSYRTLQTMTVEVTWHGDKIVAIKEIPSRTKMKVGLSESYRGQGRNPGPGEGALDQGLKGYIDPKDRDKVGDCHLRHAAHPGKRAGLLRPKFERVADNIFRVDWEGHARNGLIPQAPKIDWKLRSHVALEAGRRPLAFVSGQRDLFPAYEMYVNQKKIYRAVPPSLRRAHLPVKKIGAEALLLLGRHLYTIPKRGYSPIG